MMRKFSGLLAAAAVAAAAFAPHAAYAWRGGVVFGVVPFYAPYYVPPPVIYAPPPVVYAPPPPVVYDPAQAVAPAAARATSCDASPYICPLDLPARPGQPCSCPGNRGRVSGTAR